MKNKNKDILNKNTDSGFLIPENYFKTFEQDFQIETTRVKSGFKEPDGYFEGIDGMVMSRIKGAGYKVPEDYFIQVENAIIERYEESKNRKVLNHRKIIRLKFIGLAMAASVLLFIGIKSFSIQNNLLDIEVLEVSEIENWMDEDWVSFSNYEIQDTFSDITLANDEFYASDVIFEYLEGENIENLLIE